MLLNPGDNLRCRPRSGFHAPLARLALLYLDGQGVSQDERKAAKWFKKAAEQGLQAATKALEFIPDNVKN